MNMLLFYVERKYTFKITITHSTTMYTIKIPNLVSTLLMINYMESIKIVINVSSE